MGRSGTIVGIDRSAQMLEQARRRAEAAGWDNVILLRADAVLMDPAAIRAEIEKLGGAPASDAALATYALSLMPQGKRAWENMAALLREEGRAAIVDLQEPVGWGKVLTPLARAACALGGADIHAHPWRAVEDGCTDVVRRSARSGHLQIRAGALRRP